MTEPTDTNQANEDELRDKILTEFKQVHKLAPADYTENCTNVVMSIIRTEKLKLLSEVRERVVGEDETRIPADGGPFTNTTDKPNHYITLRNANRADQRTVLAKMEAEAMTDNTEPNRTTKKMESR